MSGIKFHVLFASGMWPVIELETHDEDKQLFIITSD